MADLLADFQRQPLHQSTLRYGGLNLQLEFDSQTRVASIQGQTVQLRDDNVILVDGVEAPAGPQVTRTLRVDATIPAGGGYPRTEEVLRRSPEILSFLQCDARLPNVREQAMIDLICARILLK